MPLHRRFWKLNFVWSFVKFTSQCILRALNWKKKNKQTKQTKQNLQRNKVEDIWPFFFSAALRHLIFLMQLRTVNIYSSEVQANQFKLPFANSLSLFVF